MGDGLMFDTTREIYTLMAVGAAYLACAVALAFI